MVPRADAEFMPARKVEGRAKRAPASGGTFDTAMNRLIVSDPTVAARCIEIFYERTVTPAVSVEYSHQVSD